MDTVDRPDSTAPSRKPQRRCSSSAKTNICDAPTIGLTCNAMKLTADRPFADPEKAARRLMQHAHAFEPLQAGRIYVEVLNGPFLFGDKGTPAEYTAGWTTGSAKAG